LALSNPKEIQKVIEPMYHKRLFITPSTNMKRLCTLLNSVLQNGHFEDNSIVRAACACVTEEMIQTHDPRMKELMPNFMNSQFAPHPRSPGGTIRIRDGNPSSQVPQIDGPGDVRSEEETPEEGSPQTPAHSNTSANPNPPQTTAVRDFAEDLPDPEESEHGSPRPPEWTSMVAEKNKRVKKWIISLPDFSVPLISLYSSLQDLDRVRIADS
jgi:hypothetical protein